MIVGFVLQGHPWQLALTENIIRWFKVFRMVQSTHGHNHQAGIFFILVVNGGTTDPAEVFIDIIGNGIPGQLIATFTERKVILRNRNIGGKSSTIEFSACPAMAIDGAMFGCIQSKFHQPATTGTVKNIGHPITSPVTSLFFERPSPLL
nr:hypothetical protein [Syntrophotalea carbinolica]